MSAPSTDHAAIMQVLRALKAAGHTLVSVNNGEDDVPVTTPAEALIEATAADEAYLFVTLPDGRSGWIRFVLGNDPEEVVCDHTTNLSPVLDPITERWNA